MLSHHYQIRKVTIPEHINWEDENDQIVLAVHQMGKIVAKIECCDGWVLLIEQNYEEALKALENQLTELGLAEEG